MSAHNHHDGISINPTTTPSITAPHIDYHAMIRADLEELATKYATLALTERNINPRWIAAIRIAELFL
jgi:hypothetical protein